MKQNAVVGVLVRLASDISYYTQSVFYFFRNIIDSRTYYAKTLVTIEVEGKPPSDPILIEGQTRKRLVDRRGVQLYVLKQNSVTAAILQARKEAKKRKNS